MKILFVCSGNSGGISPIVNSQADSLIKTGVEVFFFQIKGKGLWGYLSNFKRLRQHLNQNSYDLVHAHYSFSGYLAALSRGSDIVVSLMGSDIKSNNFFKIFNIIFSKFFWAATIVKSEDMKKSLGLNGSLVIANGVDLKKFCITDQITAQNELGWDGRKLNLLFAANPDRKEKNFELVKKSIEKINNSDIKLHFLQNVPFSKMNVYYNAADGVLLSSLWEGSPNVIKEAMACNKPIVSTDVGDVRYVFGDVEGCYLSDFSLENYSESVNKMLNFVHKKMPTKGRDQLINLKLTTEDVALKLIGLYSSKIKR